MNASTTSPEHACWALAHSFCVGVSSTRAILAYLVACIVILSIRALYTFNSIKYWSRSRTIKTLALFDAIDLIGGATETLPLIEIEIFWMEAFDAAVASPKLPRSALALL